MNSSFRQVEMVNLLHLRFERVQGLRPILLQILHQQLHVYTLLQHLRYLDLEDWLASSGGLTTNHLTFGFLLQ